MRFLLALLVTGPVGVSAVCDLCSPLASATSIAETMASAAVVPLAPPRIVVLTVKGMTCGGCVIGTRTVLGRLPGVLETNVSYEESRATVTYDPDKVTVQQIIEAIGTLGYKAAVRSGPATAT